MKKFALPTLYKKTSTGAIQQWEIWTEGSVIYTAYGQVGGKIQETADKIKEGKNIGRSNETTKEEQALFECEAKWKKQLKKGYVQNKKDAEKGIVDEVIEGGIAPMLAHRYDEQGHKIRWGAYLQRKYDGLRIIAIVKNGKASLWTRTRKPITGLPHIQRELEELFPRGYHAFDGEGYSHQLKFEQIISFARQEKPIAGHEQVQYHIYDLPQEGTFEQRLNELNHKIPNDCEYLRKVETILVENEEEAMELISEFLEDGFEGGIVRNREGVYKNGRSYDIQKIKSFVDAEFPIISFEEGRGKLMKHLAAFICKTPDGVEFKAKMTGELTRLKEYFDDHSLWKNKQLTVKYQGLTAYGAPRFPVGIIIRDYE